MKLAKANRFLRSPVRAASALRLSAKSSSAVEGVRRPFVNGRHAWQPASAEALIAHWKKRSSRSGR